MFSYNPADMARHRKTNRPPIAEKASAPIEPSGPIAVAYLVVLSLLAVICFFPLLTYYFAQDDFTLMLKAWRDGWSAVADYFYQKPGMFRPLTKAVYFGAMHGVFGLNSVPFHIVSMAVHLVNTILVYTLSRRLMLSRTASLVPATLFALSVAFFHVIAWISCIQQLLGLLFMLSALIWGIDYGKSRSSEGKWWSLGAYVLALLSVEQTLGVPLILVARAWLSPGAPDKGIGLRRAIRIYAPHLAVLVVYTLFMAFWKTPPGTGSYTFSLGGNVAVNLLTYLGWSLQFGAALPAWMQSDAVPWSVSHLFMIILLAYLIIFGRWRETVFGLLIFVVAVFPTLFLSRHTFYLHTYIPSFGVLYLIAVVVEENRGFRWFRKRAARLVFLAVLLAVVSSVSFVMVRKNVGFRMFDEIDDMPRSFVLRRAIIAKNAYDSLIAHEPFDEKVKQVYMVYAREDGKMDAKWNNDNVKAATGWGSLPPLVYGNPNLETVFKLTGDAVGADVLADSDVYFYDDFGNCFAVEPVDLQ